MTAPVRPQSRNGFEVAILCALRHEADAVEGVFDEHWGDADLYGRAAGDYNNYAVGKVGEHNVVLTVMPGMGKATAAGVATRLHSSFPCIKLALLVGVCGGVPMAPDGAELVLGDIVVSTGVVQFDFGRQYPNKAIAKDTPRDNLCRPNAEIRTFLAEISGLRAKSLLRNSTSRHLAALLRKKEFELWKYPGSEEDTLYEATYRHKHHDSTECPICTQCQNQYDDICDVAPKASCKMLQCDPARLVSRDRLKISKTNEAGKRIQAGDNSLAPVIHFGLVASGDLVMKSGQHRDELAYEKEVIAFEMEGAGVWDNLPTIIVKGICDYADCHKNKIWQNYAAATGAACTKALLEKWRVASNSSGTSSETKLIVYNPQNQPTTPNSLIPREAWPLDSSGHDMWSQLVSRISDYDYTKAHRRLRSRRLPGTVEWFLSHTDLKDWLQNSMKATLWLSGKVGSGKTMICTRLIDVLRNQSLETGEPIVYFYCNSSEPRTTEARYLVESMIKQLLDCNERLRKPCPVKLKNGIERYYTPAGPEPDLEDLLELFAAACASFSAAWFVIDGLDELSSDEISQVLSCFRTICLPGGSRKLLIASRYDLGPNVRVSLELHIQLLQAHTEEDLGLFIDSEISRKMNHERVLTKDGDLLEDIRKHLHAKAEGMFLWVRLQIESLWLDCHSRDEILSALDNLPADLNATYERCLRRIPAATSDLAVKVLRWLVCASRPLQVYELQEAVGFTLDYHEWNIDKCPLQSTITSSCRNLIELDTLDKTIRIIHPSVKQYLCGLGTALPGRFHIQIEKATLECGEECVNYLSFSNFGQQLQKKPEIGIVASVPVRAGPSVVLASLPFGKVTGRLSNFFNNAAVPRHIDVLGSRPIQQPIDSNAETKYGLLNYARQNWTTHTRTLTKSSKLWIRFETLALQPNTTWNLQPWSPSGQSYVSFLHGLLSYAARENNPALLTVLLENGNDYGIKDFCNLPLVEDGLPALHAAARLGHTDALPLLLRICKVNAIDSEARTALHYAAHKNHIEVAHILLAVRGVLINAAATNGETPLYLAAISGFTEMVSYLLARGAVPPKDTIFSHPLVGAARRGNLQIISLLTAPNVTLASSALQNAIVEAAEHGHREAVTLLLDRTRYIKNALAVALERSVKRGHPELVEFLLSRCTNVNSRFHNGRSVLHLAVSCGQEEIVRLLLKRQDVNVNLLDEDENTPLILAISVTLYPYSSTQEAMAVLKGLLDNFKVDVNARNQKGETALLLAVRGRKFKAVQLLLERPDIDVNIGDNISDRPLTVAMEDANEEIFHLFLQKKDLRINLAGEEWTLRRAARSGNVGVVMLLLKRLDIEINSKDSEGRTPLILAASQGNTDVVQLLLEDASIDANRRDHVGKTALFYAAELGEAEPLQRFLSSGMVNVNCQDRLGQTPLHVAVRNGFKVTARLLLQKPELNLNLRDKDGLTALSHAYITKPSRISTAKFATQKEMVQLLENEISKRART